MAGLALLSAPGLLLLLGLAPIALLYRLRTRRQRLKVSSTWLWTAARRELRARHPWKRLTAELPLLLEILALVALALALARPASRGGDITGEHVAIVIDTSASMLARATSSPNDTTTRFEAAQRAALGIVNHLALGADAFVIEAGSEATAAAPRERDRRRLSAILTRLSAHAVEGNLAGAMGLAVDRLRELPGSHRIVVITDAAGGNDSPLPTGGIPTDVIQVGEAVDNAGIVGIDARRGFDPASKLDTVEVFAQVQSFADHPREAWVTVTREGNDEPTASRHLVLAANAKTPVLLGFEPGEDDDGRGLSVHLEPTDAFATDDVGYARVPGGHALPVVLVSDRPMSWARRALEADPDVALRAVTVADLSKPGAVDPDALVVVEGMCPKDIPGRDVMVLAPPEGECLGVHVGSLVRRPRVTSWDTGDPRLRFLTLDAVHLTRTRDLSASEARAALVRSEATPLVLDASLPGRTATLVGFDLADSDWPLQASFVLFVRDVVELARSHRSVGAAVPAHPGVPIRFAAPRAVAQLHVALPGVGSRDVQVRDGFAVVSAPMGPGWVEVRWNESPGTRLVVPINLASTRESDLRPGPLKLDVESGQPVAMKRAADALREWTTWLAIFATVVMSLELFWLTRSPRGARRRRLGAATVARAALGITQLVYLGAVRVGLLDERFVRFESPAALLVVAVVTWALAIRFASPINGMESLDTWPSCSAGGWRSSAERLPPPVPRLACRSIA